jgi:pyridoxine 4-dehydrogenase
VRGAHSRIVLGLYRTRPTRHLIEAALELGVQHIDTAYSYHHGKGHTDLAEAAGNLGSDLVISTKVGFFPDGRHCIDPKPLREAIERSCEDLGRPADLVFLHNPEASLERYDTNTAQHALAQAFAVLTDAVRAGLCRSWGITSWNPGPVVGAVTRQRPDVLMIRAGLSVSAHQLALSEELINALAPRTVWGMSPFAGTAADPIWRDVNARQFLQPGQDCTDHQAVFRTAFALPNVDRIAVGTNNTGHLHELAAATELHLNDEVLARYRELLALRSAVG